MKTKKQLKKIHLQVVLNFLADYFEDETWITEGFIDLLKQGNPKAKYYALLETEANNCYYNEGWFLSPKKLMKLVIENSRINAQINSKYTTWDKITVLDIDAYKIVQ